MRIESGIEVRVSVFVDEPEQSKEIGEGECRDGAESEGIFLIECSNGLVHIHVFGRYPLIRVLSVAFSLNEVLELLAEYAGIQDFVDFVFFFTINLNRLRS